MFGDNESAQTLSKNGIKSERTKHIAIKYAFIHSEVESGRVSLEWISTKKQVADIFTKSLPRLQHEKLREKLLCVTQEWACGRVLSYTISTCVLETLDVVSLGLCVCSRGKCCGLGTSVGGQWSVWKVCGKSSSGMGMAPPSTCFCCLFDRRFIRCFIARELVSNSWIFLKRCFV